MDTLVAICENSSCGMIFTAPNIIAGPGMANVTMIGSRVGPCPRCGSYGRIPDGEYFYSNNVVKFLRGPKASVDVLKRVEDILRRARSNNLTKEETLEEVEKVSPEVAESIRKAPLVAIGQQWIAIAITLITLAILIQQTYFKGSDKELEKMFIEHLLKENQLQSGDSPKNANISQSDNLRKKHAAKPNDPCTCGRGRKYKKCCGAAVRR